MFFTSDPYDIAQIDAVYILSGTAVKSKDGDFRPGTYSDRDHHGLSADGQSKCEAAAHLYRQNNYLNFIASGAVLPIIGAENEEAIPTYSEIYAQELQSQGIPAHNIVYSSKPIDTVTELISLIEIASTHDWLKVLILSNQSQINRVRTLFDMVWNYPLPGATDQTEINRLSIMLFTNRILARNENVVTANYLKSLIRLRRVNFQVYFSTSEYILIQQNSANQAKFEEIYKSIHMQQRVEIERKGVKHIVEGTYYLD